MKRSRSFFFKIRLWSGWSSNSVFWTVFPTLSNVKLKKFPTLVSGELWWCLLNSFPTLSNMELNFFPTLVSGELWWCSQRVVMQLLCANYYHLHQSRAISPIFKYKKWPLSAFKLGFRGKFEENETKMFEEKK